MISIKKSNCMAKMLTIALLLCYIFPTLVMYHTANLPTGLDNIILQLQSHSRSNSAADVTTSRPSLELIRILHATAELGTIEKNEDNSAETAQRSLFKIPHLLPSERVVVISCFMVKNIKARYFRCISVTFPPDVPPPRELPC